MTHFGALLDTSLLKFKNINLFMCGFAGILTDIYSSNENLVSNVEGMLHSILHRGPDDRGVWTDTTNKFSVGHCRLSILDLSPAGHQPMLSSCGRYVIAYNGEIYNHLEIRKNLRNKHKNISWRGGSDTETLLEAISILGIQSSLEQAVGMFSFALWDKEKKILTLARDRFGEKPLYYGWVNNNFVFGSELKAIVAHPEFNNPINKEALGEYFRFMYIPSPLSIYENIHKLNPGTFVQIINFNIDSKNLIYKTYWDLKDVIKNGENNQFVGEDECCSFLESALDETIKSQMVADVPIGAFLSGGIDSSLVVSLMQKMSFKPVKTFTIGFDDGNFSEAEYAKKVAKHLNTDHDEIILAPKQVQLLSMDISKIYDEPFADSSQIPTYLICQSAKKKVTVCLSGDGGDEIFGGYNRYYSGPDLWKKLSFLPYNLRKFASKGLSKFPSESLYLSKIIYNLIQKKNTGVEDFENKFFKLISILENAKSIEEVYIDLITEWKNPADIIKDFKKNNHLNKKISIDKFKELNLKSGNISLQQSLKMMYFDSISYLPDDILCKVDRASMKCSLETRVPYLDYRIADVAWKIPANFKIKNNVGKLPLRKILNKYVPKNLTERPKAGFSIPLRQWLRGPLKDWATNLLDKKKLDHSEHLRSDVIQKIWSEHLNNKRDHTQKIWSVLMFQSWLENNNNNNYKN